MARTVASGLPLPKIHLHPAVSQTLGQTCCVLDALVPLRVASYPERPHSPEGERSNQEADPDPDELDRYCVDHR